MDPKLFANLHVAQILLVFYCAPRILQLLRWLPVFLRPDQSEAVDLSRPWMKGSMVHLNATVA